MLLLWHTIGYVRDTTGSYTVDLYIFSGMSGVAGILSFILSIIDAARGGALNLPSHTSDPHSQQRSEEVIGAALTGTDIPNQHSIEHLAPHEHHTHHDAIDQHHKLIEHRMTGHIHHNDCIDHVDCNNSQHVQQPCKLIIDK